MANERTRAIAEALDAADGGAFQTLVIGLLSNTQYPSLNPLPHSHDLGQDARTEPIFARDGDRLLSFSISKKKSITKLKEDCESCKRAGHPIDAIIHVTKGTVDGPLRKKWEAEIQKLFLWPLVVHDKNWIMLQVERPEFEQLVDSTLSVPPPGGDFLSTIRREFARLTTDALAECNTSLPLLGDTIERPEVRELIVRLSAPAAGILVAGEAGSGKSGLLALLEHRTV